MRILVGDIGGTNTRLARWEDGHLGAVTTVESGGFTGLEGPVDAWLAEHGNDIDAASFGVAGPVRDGVCVATNLPWVVDGPALSVRLGVPVHVMNDFYAAARGIGTLGPADLAVIVPGTPVLGAPVAVLGAGTGLGEAMVVGDVIVPGEGAHAEFGPGSPRELALAGWLMERFGRASWEDVLSGPGLVNLARFARVEHRRPPDPRLEGPDAAAWVAEHEPAILEWFCALYGSEAGNLALRTLARGGVYLCGGIAPRILGALRSGAFATRFFSKGKVSAALAGVPVYCVTTPTLGLLGAADEAARHLR